MNKKDTHSNRVLESSGLPSFALKMYEELEKNQKETKTTLDLGGIDKVYENGFQAIFGTSLKLKKGEFLALLGPSGCGKSTTLRMIAGLETVTKGSISINDVDVTHLDPSNRNLTMVFQNYALFPHMTVKANISFGLKANKKKLGKGGVVYNEMIQILNEIESLKTLVKKVENVSKREAFVDKLNNKLIKKQSELMILNKKSELESKNTKLSKKVENKEIEISTIEDSIDRIGKEVISFKVHKKDLPKFKDRIQKLIKTNHEKEIQRKKIAVQDNYKEIINTKVNEAGKTLGLDYYLDRKPSELSGGQRQRVALGRSIVGYPSLFLMDEPLSNLDAKLRATMRRTIRTLHEKINTATVYVTHDQIEAMTMADKIAVMQDGFIMQIGSPKEIFNHPSCLFVATFVGSPSMNVLSGTFKNKVFTSDTGIKIAKLPKPKYKRVVDGQRIVLGLRPTDFSFDKVVKESYGAEMKVKIITRELLGNTIQFTGLIIGTKQEIVFLTSSYNDVKIGATTKIYPILSRAHIFDEETTIALTSDFNYETLKSLKNWSVSGKKIQIRRKILEDAKRKANKPGLFKTVKNLITKKTVKK